MSRLGDPLHEKCGQDLRIVDTVDIAIVAENYDTRWARSNHRTFRRVVDFEHGSSTMVFGCGRVADVDDPGKPFGGNPMNTQGFLPAHC